jgi:long-chain acyl-CoA synthetase
MNMDKTSNQFWNNLINYPNNTALIDTETRNSYTYSEINLSAEEISVKLNLPNKGLIFLFTQNNHESVVLYLASLKSGNAVLLLDEKLNDEIRVNLINTYNPEFLISSSKTQPNNYKLQFNIFSLNVYKNKDLSQSKIFPDLAVLLSTSGTTGSPKLVRLTYRNIQSNADSISEYLQIDSDEKPITTLPFSYSYGFSIINSHLFKGASIILTDRTVFFKDFWNLFNEYKCTSFAGVPYTYTMLKRTGFNKLNLPTLKTMTQAGGKLSEEFIRHFQQNAEDKGIDFYVMYGQTEAAPRISYVPPAKLKNKIGSIGISIPRGELKIVKDGNEINSPNINGEIVYKGENVMLGYAENRNDLKKGDELNGILYTGDLGYKDVDGYFYVTGRIKRFIKLFGLRINLDEVQKMIENHFGISAVCAGKDELLKILIQTDDHLMEINVKNEVLKFYKINFKSVVVKSTNHIPTSNTGKYDYKMINRMFDELD